MTIPESIYVLYVGKHRQPARSIFDTLQQAGYKVDLAAGLDDGLIKSQHVNYEVIIVDQPDQPRQSLRTVGALAAKFKQTTAIVFIAAAGQEKLIIEAMEEGATDYLVSDNAGNYVALGPVVIERALRQRRLLNEKQQAEAQLKLSLTRVERAKQEWEATVDSLNQLVCLLDDQGRVVRANRTVERWNLAQVTQVQGYSLHELLHPDCSRAGCYLPALWSKAWRAVRRGETVEFELEDPLLGGYFALQIRPMSTETNWRSKIGTSFAIVVIQEITERKRAEAALHQHTRELELRNQELDAFAHTVAHDLQNPLGLVIGFASALAKHYDLLSQEEVELYSSKILTTGHKMSKIVHELLLLASLRRHEIKLAPLDMADLVNEAQRRLVGLINESGAKIVVPAEWPVALGYGPWIEEVWVNYISNGIKYGGQPPRLSLGADRQSNDTIRFWVRDNGLGLTPEQQQQLFKPFTRLEVEKGQGHGLGLSIVRSIMEKLGGQVQVESPGLGHGSTFSFTLPAAFETS